MSDSDATDGTGTTDEAVEAFLADVDRVFDEYDQGYMNADVALDLVADHVEDLRDSVER